MSAIARFVLSTEGYHNYRLATGKASQEEVKTVRLNHLWGATKTAFSLFAPGGAVSLPFLGKSIHTLNSLNYYRTKVEYRVLDGSLWNLFMPGLSTNYQNTCAGGWGDDGIPEKERAADAASGCPPKGDSIYSTPTVGFRANIVLAVSLAVWAGVSVAMVSKQPHKWEQLKQNLRGVWNPAQVAQELYQKESSRLTVANVALAIVALLLAGVGGIYGLQTYRPDLLQGLKDLLPLKQLAV